MILASGNEVTAHLVAEGGESKIQLRYRDTPSAEDEAEVRRLMKGAFSSGAPFPPEIPIQSDEDI